MQNARRRLNVISEVILHKHFNFQDNEISKSRFLELDKFEFEEMIIWSIKERKQ